jgi:hypothetical protein
VGVSWYCILKRKIVRFINIPDELLSRNYFDDQPLPEFAFWRLWFCGHKVIFSAFTSVTYLQHRFDPPTFASGFPSTQTLSPFQYAHISLVSREPRHYAIRQRFFSFVILSSNVRCRNKTCNDSATVETLHDWIPPKLPTIIVFLNMLTYYNFFMP